MAPTRFVRRRSRLPARQPVSREAAAETSHANTGSNRSSCSGCHCTPTTGRPVSSTASTTPSGACPTHARPAPGVGDGLVVQAVDRAPRPVDRRAACCPRRTAPRARRPPPTGWAARCWCRVPPRCTLSSCSPRQIASTGRSRSSAAASSASSRSSRARSTRTRRVRLFAVQRGVDVGAAGEHERVHPGGDRAGVGARGHVHRQRARRGELVGVAREVDLDLQTGPAAAGRRARPRPGAAAPTRPPTAEWSWGASRQAQD